MTCEQAMELLSPWLDGELDPELQNALEAHLETCPDCKALADALRGLDGAVAGLREPAPQSLKQGVLYKIDQATGKAKKSKFRWFGPGTALGAVAAVLVLLVGLGVIPLKGRSMDAEMAKPAAEDYIAAPDTRPAEIAAPEQEPLNENKHGFYYLPNSGSDKSDSVDKTNGIEEPAEASPLFPAETQSPAWESIDGSASPASTRYAGGAAGFEDAPEPVTDEVRDACAALCAEEDAMVLAYTEFDCKSLFALLKAEEPELFALVEKLEPEERDGMLVFETDCGTALAIHEWLLEHLPKSLILSADTAEAETELWTRMEELDPGSGSLYKVITWARTDDAVAWPEEWPEGWADRVRTEENWGLFFPSEDYTPNAGKTAYLAFAK